MKQVRESVKGAAYVVLNKKREHVATVQYKFPNDGAGRVQCDVWSRKPGEKYLSLTHQKYAGGYGYDKRAAALSGAVIEGYRMADHCGRVEESGEKKRAALMRAYIRSATREELKPSRYWENRAEKLGCSFANYCRTDDMPLQPDGHGYRYTSLHNRSGLDRLQSLGFTVIDAL